MRHLHQSKLFLNCILPVLSELLLFLPLLLVDLGGLISPLKEALLLQKRNQQQ